MGLPPSLSKDGAYQDRGTVVSVVFLLSLARSAGEAVGVVAAMIGRTGEYSLKPTLFLALTLNE